MMTGTLLFLLMMDNRIDVPLVMKAT